MMATIAFQFLFLAYLTLSPGDWVTREFAELVNDQMPFYFRVQILELIGVNLAVAWAIQLFAELLVGQVKALQKEMINVSCWGGKQVLVDALVI